MAFIALKYGSNTLIHDCEAAWNEVSVSGVTVTLDAADKKAGSNSVQLAVTSTPAAGALLAARAIASKDLSACLAVQCWVKSSINVAEGALALLLDNTAQCASPLEVLALPAIPANTWTLVVLPLAAPASDTAIISVGLRQVVDLGAVTLHIDDVNAVIAKVFSPMAVKGFDDVDHVRLWPPIQQELLDGSLRQTISSFAREIMVDLGVVPNKTDRVWLINYVLSNSMKLIYANEELAVVLTNPREFYGIWLFDYEGTRGYVLELSEQAMRTTAPSSWQ